jgi:hypothetical protein
MQRIRIPFQGQVYGPNTHLEIEHENEPLVSLKLYLHVRFRRLISH